jgi:DNA-directed RNA polymerase subunit M/transcription elongation factor TFIIS
LTFGFSFGIIIQIYQKEHQMIQDNQQRSLKSQGVQLLTRTEKRKGKWYGLYKCPSCNNEVELRIDTINTHYKRHDYPKLCSACANANAGKSRVKHGDCGTRLYSIWKNMHSRVSDTSPHTAYTNISVCDEWKSYETFKAWALSTGYSDELTIDRKDPNSNYTPSNCRWLTLSENSARANLRGEPNSCAKLSPADVTIIKDRLSKGETHQAIADDYGVARTTITWINKERSTTIPKGSTSEAIADGNSEPLFVEGEDIV